MKHTLIVIGYIGGKSCYLDIAREEAIRRYFLEHVFSDRVTDLAKPGFIEEIKFEDEFLAYEVWAK